MTFVPFAMERWQSIHEHVVDLNLSESGVHPLTLGVLLKLAGVDRDALDGLLLEYIQSNGGQTLRERVAAIYPDAVADNVVITSGSAEANFVCAWDLAAPDGEFIFMEPNYYQIRGVAENLGVSVKSWWLDQPDWEANLEALKGLVTDRTRAIFVCNPNNPTGRSFGTDFIQAVTGAAARVGAWVLADEVYRGAEHSGPETPTFWGSYERVLAVSGLSKAYGLPGLRIGWVVGPTLAAERLWGRKDYTTISHTAISEYLATAALATGPRHALLSRTRDILNANWPVLEHWLGERADIFRWRAPEAGAIALVEFRHDVDTEKFAEELRVEESCLIQPGSQFGLPRHLRLGIGPPTVRLQDGLDRLDRVVQRTMARRLTA
jgi:hypothetical protein